ncbi:MAG: zinc ribbon domain-containing protein [Pyrinomonadaceae bacterium]|nr:zinc ribbon domain-containing protein [Pyrinomonadaceae bacterium]
MFCPHCGQQQISDEVRFCSRCGFALGGVAELIARGGTLPQETIETGKPRRSPRYEGVRQGVLMLFIGAILVPILAILFEQPPDVPFGFPALLIPLASIILFLGGILRILYARIYEEGAPRKLKTVKEPSFATAEQISLRASAPHAAQLPPSHSTPIADYLRPQMRTAEMMQPPSVTESTTRLLEEDRDRTRPS